MEKRDFQTVVALGLAAMLAGCSSMPKGAYRPKPGAEAQEIHRSIKNIYPNDVRNRLPELRNTELAWVGVIKDIEFRDAEDEVRVAFLVEHRYFDWEVHRGGAPYHLSAQGEGEFTAGWEVPKPTTIAYLQKQARRGDMLVVYGKPLKVKDGIVFLDAAFVRTIPKAKFRDDLLPSSRPVPADFSSLLR